jgi:hypothetical protein
MEYRGIRYTLRAGIERGQWFVVIHPDDIEILAKKSRVTHEDAEFHARRMIDGWLGPKSKANG